MDNNAINTRIAAEQAKIDVPSYQDAAWDGAWKRRTGGMWGVGALGLITGAFIGVGAAAAAAFATGGALALPILGKSVALFSALGMSGGWAVGGLMGQSSGAAASAMKEYERRTLARDIEKTIRENPEATVTLGEKSEPEKQGVGIRGYVHLRNMLIFAAIGAATGLIFAGALVASGALAGGAAAAGGLAAYAMPAMGTLLGDFATSVPAVTAYSAGVGATFGSIFGLNFPRISRNFTNFANDMLSGKAIGVPWSKEANLPDLKPILSPIVQQPEEPGRETSFASKEKRAANYEALVAQSIKEADAQMTR